MKKTFMGYGLMFNLACCSAIAEEVNKGDYFAWKFAKDSLAYVDGDFMSWRTNDSDDSYEFKQHFIWTDDELKSIMKKTKFTDEEIETFFEIYNYNFTDVWYVKHDKETPPSDIQINSSASVYELYYTCIAAEISEKKCHNLFLDAYEASVNKFNEQSSKEYRTYNTYGPLNLPITALVWRLFDWDGRILCRAGKQTPEIDYSLIKPVKIVETDSLAICSYSEETETYKCLLNRFFNENYRCSVTCEGNFSLQGNDLVYSGVCNDQWIIPKSRPSLFDLYVSDEFKDIIYDPDKDKKLKKVQKKNKRDY